MARSFNEMIRGEARAKQREPFLRRSSSNTEDSSGCGGRLHNKELTFSSSLRRTMPRLLDSAVTQKNSHYAVCRFSFHALLENFIIFSVYHRIALTNFSSHIFNTYECEISRFIIRQLLRSFYLEVYRVATSFL